MKHTILLTFDYELFLGESGSVNNCLLKPTNYLLNIFNKNNSHCTFFIDVVYLLRLQEVGDLESFAIIKDQIQNMLKGGHDIGLHIHPHWVDAEYLNETRTWRFTDFSKYKISNCPKNILDKLFDDGVNLLNSIAHEVLPNYNVISFRAGGWCADPISNISDCLRRNGIYVDSSVIPYRKLKGNSISSFDYSDISFDSPYRFKDSLHCEDHLGDFVEIPLSTYTVSPFCQFKSLIQRKISSPAPEKKRFGDGKSVFDIEKNSDIARYAKYLRSTRTYYSCDSSSESIIERIREDKSEVIVIVAHPKCLSQHSLSIIDNIASMSDSDCMSISEFVSVF